MTCVGCPDEGLCGYCGRPSKRDHNVSRDYPIGLPTTGVHNEETT